MDIDLKYAKIVKDCLDYIVKIRTENPTMKLLDIIQSFCFEHELDVEEVGDAISQDYYFKQLIEDDMKISEEKLNNQQTELDEW